MQTEKKLIAYCFIAVLVGVAAVTPLLFLMSGTASAQTETDKPWFNLNSPYGYWTANSTVYPNGTASYSNFRTLALNITENLNTIEESTADARVEYFQILVYADGKTVENSTYFFGCNRTDNFTFEPFQFAMGNMFNLTNISLGGYLTVGTTSNKTSDVQFEEGGGTFFFGTNLGNQTSDLVFESGGQSGRRLAEDIPQRITDIQNATTITVTIQRFASVTYNGNSTTITLGNGEILQQIQLTKFGEGFLYNELVPDDQLTQIDLRYPLRNPLSSPIL